jgi:hypothetical protein
MLTDLQSSSLIPNNSDEWKWKFESNGLLNLPIHILFLLTPPLFDVPFNLIWKAHAPTKVIGCLWKILHNGLPTRDNLKRRGMLNAESSILCALCKQEDESINHLFFSCNVAYHLWMKVYKCVQFTAPLPNTPNDHFQQHAGGWTSKKPLKFWNSIWLATIWSLWKWRNDLIFNEAKSSIQDILDLVQLRSWLWIRSKSNIHFLCSFFEWCTNVRLCLLSIK